jgi:hypothetical protein
MSLVLLPTMLFKEQQFVMSHFINLSLFHWLTLFNHLSEGFQCTFPAQVCCQQRVLPAVVVQA